MIFTWKKITIEHLQLWLKKPWAKRHKSNPLWRKERIQNTQTNYPNSVNLSSTICISSTATFVSELIRLMLIPQYPHRLNDCTQLRTPSNTPRLNLRIPPKKNTLEDDHSNNPSMWIVKPCEFNTQVYVKGKLVK